MTTAAVVAEWSRRVASEYISGLRTQQITLWLTEIGASPDLIDDGLRIAADELRHARLCTEVASAAGATSLVPIDRVTARLTETGDPGADAVRAVLQLFCLGETLAVSMFAAARMRASVPIARDALTTIVRDEVRHRSFGWDALGWLLDALPDARATAHDALPILVDGFARLYEPGIRGMVVTDDELAWGLMSTAEAATLVDRAIRFDWPRRFADHGIAMG